MNLLLFSRGRWSCNDQVPSTFLQLTPSLRIRTVYTAAHIQKWTAVLISLWMSCQIHFRGCYQRKRWRAFPRRKEPSKTRLPAEVHVLNNHYMIIFVNGTAGLSSRYRVRRPTMSPYFSCYACLTVKGRFC